jgi:HEAT repeat protein
MHRHLALTTAALTCVVALPSIGAAQQPRIENGRISTQPAGSPFASSFRSLVSAQTDIAWIGYSVPVVESERTMCCFQSGGVWINGNVVVGDRSSSWGGGCGLEPSGDATTKPSTPAAAPTGPIKLEGSGRMAVLFRIADRTVDRIRVFSEDCALDAGGRPVVWLENVRDADSVALLESYATTEDPQRRDRIMDGAVSAIAMHRDLSADAALDRLIAPARPDALRKKVTFWLGNARGRHGLDTLVRLLRDDTSDDVRKSAVFGVSQSRQPNAFDVLASLAHADKSDRIRSEAVFWVAHKDDARAAGVIQDALSRDPSIEVRKKAVFALSQLKDERGIPALLETAKTHETPAVRSEAIFWLGQKAGRKAADAITERIDQDPDTEVKKKAVFALSQLPKEEGIPLLIKVARTNTNAAVRKQAMFWLGQSKDPRAIDFFAEVLAK